nr:MAG TPA: hypothetical protein [Bacteriophage sp.]
MRNYWIKNHYSLKRGHNNRTMIAQSAVSFS